MTYIHFLGAVALLAASASAWMQSHHHHDVSSVHSRVTGRVVAKERFVRQRSKIDLSNSRRRIGSVLASTTDGFDSDDDGNDWEDGTLDGSAMAPEKSQMNSFVRNFLRKTNANENEEDTGSFESTVLETMEPTHCVAILMDNCDELMLELESIQRAILYHCPILVNACIPQATSRIPLLYVTINDDEQQSNQQLAEIVDEVVKNHLFPKNSQETAEPLMLPFQTLEIDGKANEVLQTVGQGDSATKLKTVVEELQARFHDKGWSTELPVDPESADGSFRPRLPFMRLPQNWDELLAEERNGDEDRFLTSDEGGNGISPILWFKWLEDDFGTARMREIGVYQRRRSFSGNNEQAFYFPYDSVQLPLGDEKISKEEKKYRDYQDSRMQEAERLQAQENEDGEIVNDAPIADDDLLLQKTRDRLEILYKSPATDDLTLESDPETETSVSASNSNTADSPAQVPIRPEAPKDEEVIDDWTKKRIEQVIANRQKAREDLAKAKDKPPIEENDVFAKYREGTLVPKEDQPAPMPALPPFPSREHCIGFWRVISSPTGFPVEEGDASRSDNLILRVDGTTAGGPILDQETRQKASGGTWRFYGDKIDDAKLIIRLVIPPKKERVLVMEGHLEKASLSSDVALASSSFGIPELEERKKQSIKGMDDLLYCSGNVWIEDAVTKKNRDDIGSFSLMKMEVSTDSYTITVPKPVRNQD